VIAATTAPFSLMGTLAAVSPVTYSSRPIAIPVLRMRFSSRRSSSRLVMVDGVRPPQSQCAQALVTELRFGEGQQHAGASAGMQVP